MKLERKTLVSLGITVFVLYLCITYWPLAANIVGKILSGALPLLIGGGIAYIVNILMASYEKFYFPRTKSKFLKKTRRPICLTVAFLTLFAIIALICVLVLPELISCIKLIASLIPTAFSTAIDWLQEKELLPADILASLSQINWQDVIQNLWGVLTSGLGSVMDVVIQTVTSVVGGIITGFLAIVFAIYLLSSKEKIGKQCRRLLKRYTKEDVQKKVLYCTYVADDCFHRYIVGQCTEAVILGLLCMLGMTILRLPYSTMIGALIAFTALIPVAGAYIGAAVGAFMILTVSPIKAIIFLIFIIVLQQLEGNLIYPRVVGSSMNLPAILVLAAITVGGGLMGIFGMLLSVPVTAIIYRLIKNDLDKNLPENPPKPQPKEDPPPEATT